MNAKSEEEKATAAEQPLAEGQRDTTSSEGDSEGEGQGEGHGEGEGEEDEEGEEPVLQVKSELVGWGSEWITPESLAQAKSAVAFAGDVRQVTVAITTTDYSMQNVLLQMGLHLVAVDG